MCVWCEKVREVPPRLTGFWRPRGFQSKKLTEEVYYCLPLHGKSGLLRWPPILIVTTTDPASLPKTEAARLSWAIGAPCFFRQNMNTELIWLQIWTGLRERRVTHNINEVGVCVCVCVREDFLKKLGQSTVSRCFKRQKELSRLTTSNKRSPRQISL